MGRSAWLTVVALTLAACSNDAADSRKVVADNPDPVVRADQLDTASTAAGVDEPPSADPDGSSDANKNVFLTRPKDCMALVTFEELSLLLGVSPEGIKVNPDGDCYSRYRPYGSVAWGAAGVGVNDWDGLYEVDRAYIVDPPPGYGDQATFGPLSGLRVYFRDKQLLVNCGASVPGGGDGDSDRKLSTDLCVQYVLPRAVA